MENKTEDRFNPIRDVPRLRELAEKNIFLGTSSWKYEGWLHQVYNANYERMVKGNSVLNETKFNNECLSEYTTVFPAVCNDSSYYRLPEIKSLEKVEKELPSKFKMTFKVPDQVTLRQERKYIGGKMVSGDLNPSYLNPNVFKDYILKPIEQVFKGKLGTLIFEFSPHFWDKGWGSNRDYDHEAFVNDLDKFLGALPKGFSYAVEVRDPILIISSYDDYLNSLKKHNVTHIINAQTWMPPIEEQIKRKGIITNNHIVIRALTRPGLKHEDAKKRYLPYDQIKEPMPEMRQTIAHLMTQAEHEQWTLEAYFNNRTEGNAPDTIKAVLDIYDEMNGIEREEMLPLSSKESLELFG